MPATGCGKYKDGLGDMTLAHSSFVLEDEEALDKIERAVKY
jgi:hypothetical protein